jgi:hypothetical protein
MIESRHNVNNGLQSATIGHFLCPKEVRKEVINAICTLYRDNSSFIFLVCNTTKYYEQLKPVGFSFIPGVGMAIKLKKD